MISIDEFLVPWLSVAEGYKGLFVKDLFISGDIKKESEKIIDVAFRKNQRTAKRERKEVLAYIDRLIDLLGYSPCLQFHNIGWGATLLPERFWELDSGRVIVLALDNILGEDEFCSIRSAARIADSPLRQIYRLVNRRKLPYYIHHGVRNPKYQHRVRIDHLRLLINE